MNRKQIDKLLVKAEEALNCPELEIVDGESRIKSTFVAYTAAFGTAVIQSGLLPALVFFCSKQEDGIERYKIIKALSYMLNRSTDDKVLLKECIEMKKGGKLQYAKKTRDVVNASIALKMMMRTYKIEKNENT